MFGSDVRIVDEGSCVESRARRGLREGGAIASWTGQVADAWTDSDVLVIFVLISDLYEGGVAQELLRRAGSMINSGVQFITLLALSDEGAPSFDRELAANLSALGAPSFACSPDQFPELMAAAINRRDIAQWAAERDIRTARPNSGGR